MSDNLEHNNQTTDSPGYEARDANVGQVVIIGIAFVIILVITLVLVDQYFNITKEKDIQEMVLKPQSVTLREVRAREDEILGAYRVIDSAKGIYQIPINRAIELIAQRAYNSPISGNREH